MGKLICSVLRGGTGFQPNVEKGACRLQEAVHGRLRERTRKATKLKSARDTDGRKQAV
jgi:hypothetical protein